MIAANLLLRRLKGKAIHCRNPHWLCECGHEASVAAEDLSVMDLPCPRCRQPMKRYRRRLGSRPFRRGLCSTCYYNPAIRQLYASQRQATAADVKPSGTREALIQLVGGPPPTAGGSLTTQERCRLILLSTKARAVSLIVANRPEQIELLCLRRRLHAPLFGQQDLAVVIYDLTVIRRGEPRGFLAERMHGPKCNCDQCTKDS